MNIHFIICELLILLLVSGLCGLLLFKDNIKKISCLSVSYSSFLILFVLLAFRNSMVNEVMPIMITLLIAFSINLLIIIGIAKNIAESQKKSN